MITDLAYQSASQGRDAVGTEQEHLADGLLILPSLGPFILSLLSNKQSVLRNALSVPSLFFLGLLMDRVR